MDCLLYQGTHGKGLSRRGERQAKSIISFIKSAVAISIRQGFRRYSTGSRKSLGPESRPWLAGAALHCYQQEIGSFFFIGIILTDLALEYDAPSNDDLCVACRRCISVCSDRSHQRRPTIDARRCIAYLTIEDDNPVPDDIREKDGRKDIRM